MGKIAIACDHAGLKHKQVVIKQLKEDGHSVHDLGTNTEDSVDYPDYAHPLALEVEQGKADYGILICGSANGVAITANKHKNVRAAICWNNEVTALARQHNNANVICLPARFITESDAVRFSETFINTKFEGGRHEKRVNKINIQK